MTERKPRPKLKFTRISGPATVLVVLIILGNIFFSTFFQGKKTESNADRLKNQAAQVARQAVREKLGSTAQISFPKKPEVQVKAADTYEVASLLVTTGPGGEPHSRSWIVTLQYRGGKGDKQQPWKVISCDIGD